MMKIKTSELQGAALDWAVAKCEGFNVGVLTASDVISRQLEGETDPAQIAWIKDAFKDFKAVPCCVDSDGYKHEYSSKLAVHGVSGKFAFSSNWSQGGPIIERERICLRDIGEDDYMWEADDQRGGRPYLAETPLVAAMRCYVASKLGDEVEVPDEFC
jgi:hypothetical protein